MDQENWRDGQQGWSRGSGRRFRSRQRAVGAMLMWGGLWSAVVAADTDPQMASLGLYCTDNSLVASYLDAGHLNWVLYFNSAEYAAAERRCFRTQVERGFGGEDRVFWGDEGTYFFSHLEPPYVLVEGDPAASFFAEEIYRFGPIGVDAGLGYQIEGTARLGADFQFAASSEVAAVAGQLGFPAWDPSTRTIALELIDDTLVEPAESLKLRFHSPVASVGDASMELSEVVPLILFDDDDPTLGFEHDYACQPLNTPLVLAEAEVDVYFDGSANPDLAQADHAYIGGDEDGDGSFSYDTRCIAQGPAGSPQVMGLFDSHRPLFSPDGSWSPYLRLYPLEAYTPPDSAPVLRSVSPGVGSLTLDFSADANPIGYRASCTPAAGGAPVQAHGRASPITVDGLASGMRYHCEVAHFNVIEGSRALAAAPLARMSSPLGIPVLGLWGMSLLILGLGGLGAFWSRERH